MDAKTLRASRYGSLAAFAVALALVAALPAPAAAVKVATSTEGVGASGAVYPGGGGYEVPCSVLDSPLCLIPRQIRDTLHPILEPHGFTAPDGRWVPAEPNNLTPNGTRVFFQFEFLDPTVGEVTHTDQPTPQAEYWTDYVGVTDPSIDLRKPIAHFSSEQSYPSGGSVWDPNRPGQRLGCDLTRNVTSYSDGVPGVLTSYSDKGARAIDDLWFDVAGCEDGLPYDYYRVHFYQATNFAISHYSATNPYKGDVFYEGVDFASHWGGSVVDRELATPVVCGHLPGDTWDCYTTSSHTRYNGTIFTAERLRGLN